MKISIVIPTIGSPSQEIIKDSLDSAFQSDATIWNQIIIVDNSRNKGFSDFLKSYCPNEQRIEIYTVSEKLTMAGCWNYGLSLVKNKWHLYLHDDDILLSQNIAPHLPQSSLEQDCALISFDYEVFGTKNRISRRESVGVNSILTDTPKFVSTIINTEKLKVIGGWRDDFGYFLDLVAFAHLASKFKHLHQNIKGGKYRLHPLNSSHLTKRNQGYGDVLPAVINELFKINREGSFRKLVLMQTISYAFPESSLSSRVLKKLAKVINLRAWIY